MCYSAMIKQQIRKLGIQYDARIDYELFQTMFHRRLTDDRVKICKSLEAEFSSPENNEEVEIAKLINEYRKLKRNDLKSHLEFQEKRLLSARESLEKKETKKSLNEKRIATDKIAYYEARIRGIYQLSVSPYRGEECNIRTHYRGV